MILRNVIAPILGAVMAIFAATCSVDGCKQADGPSVGDLYTAELQACVAKSHTIAESIYCREQVDCRYGVCRTFPEMCRPGQC